VARYQYLSCHPVTRAKLASLRPTNPGWVTTVNGNGSFSATFALPDNEDAVRVMRVALEPDQAAIYVKNRQGRYPWGGPIIEQTWDPDNQTVTVTAIEWRSWLGSVFLAPLVDMTADVLYSWTNKDQLQIAREIVAFVTAGGAADGRPPITIGTELSGKNRDLNVTGLEFKTATEMIDSMANRSGGFEWTIEIRPDPSDGLPRLYFVPYFPQQGALISGLTFRKTRSGANNVVKYGPISKSSVDLRERQWATGAGQPPDLAFAVDTDPGLATNNRLMREARTSYSTVVDRTTLASHARQEREFFASARELLNVTHTLDKPDVDSYASGDRASLRLEDAWLIDGGYELPAVRIIQKSVKPNDGLVDIVLDLDDSRLPETDTAGGA
jgi:hypothetical protein